MFHMYEMRNNEVSLKKDSLIFTKAYIRNISHSLDLRHMCYNRDNYIA